jgi:hypothetical protein
MVIGFAIVAVLARGFAIGRFWQIRSDETLWRASFPMLSVARIGARRTFEQNAQPSVREPVVPSMGDVPILVDHVEH